MALALCLLFCSWTLNRARHDKCQMVCHAYGHDRWYSHCVHFLHFTQNLLKNVTDDIPYCTKVLHIMPPCDKDAMLSNYIMFSPTYPTCLPKCYYIHIRFTCPGLSTGHQLLDIDHVHEAWSTLPGRQKP